LFFRTTKGRLARLNIQEHGHLIEEMEMLRKPLFAALVCTGLAAATLSTQAAAADPVLGALIGGGIGAAIGHDVNGRHGTAVGAALGAIVGSSIAASDNRYYSDGYYSNGYYPNGYYAQSAYVGPPVYAAEPVYVAPPPVYYGPSVVVGLGPSYGYRHAYYGHRYWRHGWR